MRDLIHRIDSVLLAAMLLPVAMTVLLTLSDGIVWSKGNVLSISAMFVFAAFPYLTRRYSNNVGVAVAIVACAGLCTWQLKYYSVLVFSAGLEWDQPVYKFTYDATLFLFSWIPFFIFTILLRIPAISASQFSLWTLRAAAAVAMYFLIFSILSSIN